MGANEVGMGTAEAGCGRLGLVQQRARCGSLCAAPCHPERGHHVLALGKKSLRTQSAPVSVEHSCGGPLAAGPAAAQAGVVCGNEAVWTVEDSDGPRALLGMDLVR